MTSQAASAIMPHGTLTLESIVLLLPVRRRRLFTSAPLITVVAALGLRALLSGLIVYLMGGFRSPRCNLRSFGCRAREIDIARVQQGAPRGFDSNLLASALCTAPGQGPPALNRFLRNRLQGLRRQGHPHWRRSGPRAARRQFRVPNVAYTRITRV